MATVKRQPAPHPEANGTGAAYPAPPSAASTPGLSVQAKFAACRRELAASLIERDGEIDLILTALIAGENPLLVGHPESENRLDRLPHGLDQRRGDPL